MKLFWTKFLQVVLAIMVVGTIGLLSNCGLMEKIANKPPIIDGVHAYRQQIAPFDTTSVWVEARDPDNDELSYHWEATKGTLSSTTGLEVVWTAPGVAGVYKIMVEVTDENGGKNSGEVSVTVIGQEKPYVKIIHPQNGTHIPGIGEVVVEAEASHRNGIGHVDFYVDGSLRFSDSEAPYRYYWNLNSVSGEKSILAKAFRVGAETNPGVDSIRIFIEGVTAVP